MLPDGNYEIIVVDAVAQPDGSLRLELTIVAGDHKGEVVSMTAARLGLGEIDALGTPGTLEVAGGKPDLSLG